MDSRETKRTVPVPSAPTDGEQPNSQTPALSISKAATENNPQDESMEDILRELQRTSDPAYLHTVSMNELDRQSLTVCSTLGRTSLRERPRWASRF